MQPMRVFAACALVCAAIIGTTACDNMAGMPPTGPIDPPAPPPIVRGTDTVPGLNDIPMDRLLLTSRQAARNIVVLEGQSPTIDFARDESRPHAVTIRYAACLTYTVICDDPEDFSGFVIDEYGGVEVDRTNGSTPFSFLARYQPITDYSQWYAFVTDQVDRMGTVKVVTRSVSPFSAGGIIEELADRVIATVQSASNSFRDKIGDPHNLTLDEEDARNGTNLRAVADADLLLFVAGHARLSETGGAYRRSRASSGCKGADSACVWTDFVIHGRDTDDWGDNVLGTSVSSVKVGMGMNSVLGFFPDTESADLVRLTKACLKRTGNGIEEMLRQSGGLGVVDYTCMGALVDARDKLSAGAVTNVVVNSKTVRVSKRQLTVSK